MQFKDKHYLDLKSILELKEEEKVKLNKNKFQTENKI